MKASFAGSCWIAAFVAGFIVVGADWLTGHNWRDRTNAGPPSVALTSTTKSLRSAPTRALPFTFHDVVSALSHTFELTPFEQRDSNYAAFRLVETDAFGKIEETLRINVLETSNRITVTFSFRERVAMHYVAEFVECDLFTPKETQEIYAILDFQDHASAHAQTDRFVVKSMLSSDVGWEKLAFEFSPNHGV
jgi:hypothetical protein